MQADHKIPLIRGGKHNISNWQSICNICNVGKRRACAECKENCKECPWAFPEKIGTAIYAKLPIDLCEKLKNMGLTDQNKINNLITKAIRNYLLKE